MREPNNKKKLRRLTVLVIPEGSGNVREFRTSRDFLTAAAVLFFAALILAMSYMIYVAGEVSDERNQILALSAQLENVISGNIILQAENEDLQQKHLRMCSADSLLSDPMRALRAIRMCLEFDLSMDDELLSAMRNVPSRLSDSSMERYRDELFKITYGSSGDVV